MNADNSTEINKLYLIAATLSGVIVSGLINYWSNRHMFKKQTERDAAILSNKLLQEEKNLTRKLASKLFGIHNEYIVLYYIFIQNFLFLETYVRLSVIEQAKERNALFTNLSMTYITKVDESKAKMAALLREFSETIGEYTILNEQTKVSEMYNEYVKIQPALICDFTQHNNFVEIDSYRTQLVLKYNKIIREELDVKGVEIFKCMAKECTEKFKI